MYCDFVTLYVQLVVTMHPIELTDWLLSIHGNYPNATWVTRCALNDITVLSCQWTIVTTGIHINSSFPAKANPNSYFLLFALYCSSLVAVDNKPSSPS